MDLILTVVAIHLLACLSPGPDIFLVMLNSLRSGWKSGLATTGGILTGVLLQIALGITGITYLLAMNPTLQPVLALSGGAFLVYLGTRGLLHLRPAPQAEAKVPERKAPGNAWTQGFLVNILNGKALLYFLSLFSVLLTDEVPLPLRMACGGAMLLSQAIAFSLVALLVTRLNAGNRWSRIQHWLELLVAVVLLGLGLWIWITTLISLMD
jgi:threonine/homoserine/homoserine lactone efflux protein